MDDIRTSARYVACEALVAWERERAFADLALREALGQASLDRRDAAFASRLFFGTIQNLLRLDFILSSLSTVKIKKMHPRVRMILRAALYQIYYMDRVPDSAAVDQAVELARATGNARAAGLINALLRRAASLRDNPPSPEGLGRHETLSILYSHPLPLIERFAELVGEEELEALLAAGNAAPPTTVRVNSLKGGFDALAASLAAEGASASRDGRLESCATLSDSGSVEALSAFREGLFTVQDASSQLAVLAASPKPGDTVIDVCAAPGGKSLAAAALMENRGVIHAFDLHEHKLPLIEQNAARLGVTILTARTHDATTPLPLPARSADVVLADVPCSGLGIIRKKPDLRFKELSDLTSLVRTSRAILENAARLVKPGGILLFSTCTLTREENEGAALAFLRAHREFLPENAPLPAPFRMEKGMLTLWPHRGEPPTDGFFFCRMRRARG